MRKTAKGPVSAVEAVAEEAEATVQRAMSNESRMQDLKSSTSGMLKELSKTSAEAVGSTMLGAIAELDWSEPLGPQMISVAKNIVVGAAEMILSAINPLLGMAFSFFSGLFGGGASAADQQSEMVQAILDECKDMIEDAMAEVRRERINNWVGGTLVKINSAEQDPSHWRNFAYDTSQNWAHVFGSHCWLGDGDGTSCREHRETSGSLFLEIEFVQLMLTSCLSVGQAGFSMNIAGNDCAEHVSKGAQLAGEHLQVVKQQRMAEAHRRRRTNNKLERKVLALKSAARQLENLKPFKEKHAGACDARGFMWDSQMKMYDTLTECSVFCEKLRTCKYFAFNPSPFHREGAYGKVNCIPYNSTGSCKQNTSSFWQPFTAYEAISRPKTKRTLRLTQELKAGEYVIQHKESKKYLQAHTGQHDNLATGHTSVWSTGYWVIKSVGLNLYTIKQKKSGLYLDAHSGGSVVGDRKAVTRRGITDTRKWWITRVGPNLFTIQQMSNNRYLELHRVPKYGGYHADTREGISDNSTWVLSLQ